MRIDSLRDDLRLAARRLGQRPAFTIVAVLTLALGLGANTAIFTLVQATLRQRLPVAAPDELVRLGDNDNCCVNSGLQTDYSLFSYFAYRHRTIDERDTATAPRVTVVNEAFVRRFFADSDPLGQRFGFGGPEHAGDFQIV